MPHHEFDHGLSYSHTQRVKIESNGLEYQSSLYDRYLQCSGNFAAGLQSN